jgi:hypothetical protein
MSLRWRWNLFWILVLQRCRAYGAWQKSGKNCGVAVCEVILSGRFTRVGIESLQREMETMNLKILLCILLGALTAQAQTNVPAPVTQTEQVFVEKLEVAGKIYTNCTVRAFNPAQVIISFDGGGSMALIANLPANLQSQFNCDPVAAKSYFEKQHQIKLAQDRYYAQQAAQAALALPPGYAELASVSNQVAVLEKKLAEANAKMVVEDKRYELQFKAGQGSEQLTLTHVKWSESWRKTQIKPLQDQIGALHLQEFEIRQRYNIPDPNPKRKKPRT